MRLRPLIGASLALGAGAAYYAWRESKWIDLTETAMEVPELPRGLEGLRILHISDTHFPANGESLPRFLTAVRQLRYDIVFGTGDYVESSAGWPVAIEAMRRIEPRLGIYAVIGGHERYRAIEGAGSAGAWARDLILGRRPADCDPSPFVEALRESGVHVLINQSAAVEIGGEPVRLVGIDDAYHGLDDLPAALDEQGTDSPPSFKILLSHTPDGILHPLARGIPVALTGHTHGGQIRVPFYGAPVRHAQSVSRKRPAGLMRIGETQTYVSRGFGTSGVPLRFGCRPELGVVELCRPALSV